MSAPNRAARERLQISIDGLTDRVRALYAQHGRLPPYRVRQHLDDIADGLIGCYQALQELES